MSDYFHLSEAQKRLKRIKEGYFSLRVEKHYIYYRICNAHIETIDIL